MLSLVPLVLAMGQAAQPAPVYADKLDLMVYRDALGRPQAVREQAYATIDRVLK